MSVRALIVVITGIGLIIIVALTFFFSEPHYDTKTFQGSAMAFMYKLTKEDSASTYEMLSPTMKKQLSQTDWARQVQTSFSQYSGGLHLDSMKPLNDPYHTYQEGSDPHQVVFSLKLKNVKWTTLLILIDSGGTWQIDRMSSYLS